MNKDYGFYRLQKRVSIIIFITALLVCTVNFISFLPRKNLIEAFLHPAVSFTFFMSLIMLTVGFFKHNIARFIQLLIIFINGTAAIMDGYDSIFGIGLYLLCLIIAFKYGYFKNYTILKIIIMTAIVYILIIISATKTVTHSSIPVGLTSILYMTVFLVILYVIYSDEIKQYVRRADEAEQNVTDLVIQRHKLLIELNSLNSKIFDFENYLQPIDFRAIGITRRELEVLEAVVVFHESEKETAERLNISHETVRTHMKHIRSKLGVERKAEIIDLCRNNFKKNKTAVKIKKMSGEIDARPIT